MTVRRRRDVDHVGAVGRQADAAEPLRAAESVHQLGRPAVAIDPPDRPLADRVFGGEVDRVGVRTELGKGRLAIEAGQFDLTPWLCDLTALLVEADQLQQTEAVTVAAGMCLTNLRHESGLEPALGTEYVVMGAVRDTDPLEQELIDQSEIQHLTVADIRSGSDNIHRQMRRLSGIADLIYIHIDMDVLDPREVAGHPLTVANGPTSEELAAALETMFSYDKAAALGIASTPWGPNDPDGLSRDAAYNLIEGAIRGVQARQSQADLSASSGQG
jgi:hypothetical protein